MKIGCTEGIPQHDRTSEYATFKKVETNRLIKMFKRKQYNS